MFTYTLKREGRGEKYIRCNKEINLNKDDTPTEKLNYLY